MIDTIFIPVLIAGYLGALTQWRRRNKIAAAASKEKLAQARLKLEELAQGVEQGEKGAQVLEGELEEVSVVYHCLKNMGDVLEFAETLRVWCESLREWGRFQKGILILVETRDERQVLKNIFEISIEEKKPRFEIKNTQYARAAQQLLEKLAAHSQPVALPAGALFAGEAAVFPLAVQGELVGILALEGISDEKRDALTFLTAEFSLEIKKKLLYEKVKELSVVDSLSGLYLRRYFFQQLGFELERSLARGTPTSVLLVDIDQFKRVNDQFGHLVGDQVIQEVAQLLQKNSREVDLIGRYGGDEFAVMLPGTGRADAQRVGERFLAAMKGGRATLSIGVATAPDDGATVDALIAAADKKLYLAKQSGRNQLKS